MTNPNIPILPPAHYRLADQVPIARGDLIWTPSQVWRTATPDDYGAAAQWYGCVARRCAVAMKAVAS
jgi:hypothetical protein